MPETLADPVTRREADKFLGYVRLAASALRASERENARYGKLWYVKLPTRWLLRASERENARYGGTSLGLFRGFRTLRASERENARYGERACLAAQSV